MKVTISLSIAQNRQLWFKEARGHGNGDILPTATGSQG